MRLATRSKRASTQAIFASSLSKNNGNREPVRSRFIRWRHELSERRGNPLRFDLPSQNNNQEEKKTDEKTALNRIDGKWIGFQR